MKLIIKTKKKKQLASKQRVILIENGNTKHRKRKLKCLQFTIKNEGLDNLIPQRAHQRQKRQGKNKPPN